MQGVHRIDNRLHKRALGDFDFQRLREIRVPRQQFADMLDKGRVAQLKRGNIQRQPQRPSELRPPLRNL